MRSILGAAARLCVLGIGRRRPATAIRELLRLDAFVDVQIDRAAIAAENGVHPKHRLVRYHDFFVDRVRAGERVLDIGCGKGELAHDLAVRGGAHVVGIDVNDEYLAFARERFADPRLELVHADAFAYLPRPEVDVVVLSNVLEHIEDRVGLLARITESDPRTVLIRVPLLTRDWRVALRRDLGLPYFGDVTHQVEYEPPLLEAELDEAGLALESTTTNWGEIWAEAHPRR